MRTLINFLAALQVLGYVAFGILLSREGDPSTNAHVSKRADGPVMWCGSAAAAQYATGGACAVSLPSTGLVIAVLVIIALALIAGGLLLHAYNQRASR